MKATRRDPDTAVLASAGKLVTLPQGRPEALVVGDRAVDRTLLHAVLVESGCAVVDAESGAEGLELVRSHAPDLVICAVLMPEMDGSEFVQALRADPRTAGTTVVFWTAAFADEDIRAVAATCGVRHVICEPRGRDEMLLVVTGALHEPDMAAPDSGDSDLRERVRVLGDRLSLQTEQLEDDAYRVSELRMLVSAFQAVTPAGLALLDEDMRLVRLNDQFAALHGGPWESQVGRKLTEVVPVLGTRLERAFRQVLASGEAVSSLEAEGMTPSAPDDRRCWLASLYPVRVGDELAGIGLLVQDTTEVLRAEALRSAVMDHMAEGVLVSDHAGTLVYVNVAAAEMLGWASQAALCGTPASAVVGDHLGSDAARAPSAVRQADGIFTCSDGTLLPVAFSCSPLGAGEVMTGCVTVFRDVTTEKAEGLRLRRELDELSWVGRIRDALDEDRFVLYGQPIVSLRGEAGGNELLIRMISPSGEIIGPGAFLPAAERFGLIGEIDRWVIAQAIRLSCRGEDVGLNISARSLGDPSLLDYIKAQFEETGADPAHVIFEITETALMDNLEAGQRFAESLSALGSKIALDDFGTGFGSFTYLKRLPLRLLKIDAEFVKDLTSHPANRYLVKATVGLAHDFGYTTVAEGVEDAETLELLDELGVDFVQGFYIALPAPIEITAAEHPA